MKYDVAVIGAGPAGAMASKYAALNGAKTLLIEEHAKHRLTCPVHWD